MCGIPDTQLLLAREHGVCPLSHTSPRSPPPQMTGLRRGGRPGLAEGGQCCTRDPWSKATAPEPWWPSVRLKAQDHSGGWGSSGRHPISAWLWTSWWVPRAPILRSPSCVSRMPLRVPGMHIQPIKQALSISPLFADGQTGRRRQPEAPPHFCVLPSCKCACSSPSCSKASLALVWTAAWTTCPQAERVVVSHAQRLQEGPRPAVWACSL
ncbi:uncharacterized protein LOC122693549 [Cervus elaphus]|uniref:uncharacterized protein LOC122693549 n=1 Tax=Cervus elaphus TaxID=9860 RepID=UPI001CC2BA0D|nr:uncharacterized protein LOC122693549 [Cervus elaphus]